MKKVLLFVPALAVFAFGALLEQLFHRRIRAVTIPAAILGLAYLGWSCVHVPSAPPDRLAPGDLQKLEQALLTKVKPGGPNHMHMLRLAHYAPPFAEAEGASVDAVQAAAMLHDATKEAPTDNPKERFCHHGEDGAKFARETLLGMGKSEAFADHVATAVREHMGPCGFDWLHLRKRFMTRFCDREFPEPRSREARVLYDIDMLDLMTVDGVLKVVTLRQTDPAFGKEPIRDSALSGKDSAWKSVEDAGDTLLTSSGKACGDALSKHSRAFLDGVDWDQVKDLASFAQAVADFKRKTPIPACLPQG
jgi:hypothetical protein